MIDCHNINAYARILTVSFTIECNLDDLEDSVLFRTKSVRF